MILDVAIVKWIDAHSEAETWVLLDDDRGDPLYVTTVGLLLPRKHRKRGHISIAQSLTAHGYVDSIIHVPKKMVKSIRKLEKVRAQDGDAETDTSRGEHHS